MSFRYRNLSNARTVCQFLCEIRSSNVHHMICATNVSHICPVTRTCPNVIDSDSVTIGYDPSWRIKVDHLSFHGVEENGPGPEYEELEVFGHAELFFHWQIHSGIGVTWRDSSDVFDYVIPEQR